MADIFKFYLIENGQETLIKSSEDPREIRRILAGKSMTKRLKKGCSARLTKNGRDLQTNRLERLCLELWFMQADEDAKAWVDLQLKDIPKL